MKVAAGSIFLIMLMILSFLPLKTEVDALAVAEGAGNFETLLSTIFPFVWLFLIFVFASLVIYDVMVKK